MGHRHAREAHTLIVGRRVSATPKYVDGVEDHIDIYISTLQKPKMAAKKSERKNSLLQVLVCVMHHPLPNDLFHGLWCVFFISPMGCGVLNDGERGGIARHLAEGR